MDARWPAHDAAKAAAGDVEVVVQVNGKVRARLQVPRGTPEATAVGAAKADPGVLKFIEGREIRKVVFVPDRLVSLVV
jgi:leucyl-tRNA synthetase